MTGRQVPELNTFNMRSTVAGIVGNMLLRAGSASATGCIVLYLAFIDREVHDVPAVFLGFLAVAFYVSELTLAPVFGTLSDRYGRKLFMLLGTVLGGVAVLVLPLSPAMPIFVAVRIAEGLSSASSVPAVLGHLAANSHGSAAVRGRIMAVFEVATIIGFGLGFVMSGFFWDRLHEHSFYAVSLVYGAALLVFTQVLSRPGGPAAEHPHAGWEVYKRLAAHSSTIGFAPAWVTINAVLGMWFAHLGFQLAQVDDPSQLLVGGFTGTQVGLATGGLALAFVIGTACWAAAFGRIATQTIMTISVSALGVCCVFLYLLNHTLDTSPGLIAGIVAVVVLLLLVVSGFTPAALAHLAEISEGFKEHRGGVMGLYSVLLGLGQLLGGWVGGLFAQLWAVDGLIYATVLLGLVAQLTLRHLAHASRRTAARLEGSPAV
ncbi:MAG: MFS transporter [Dehalococcoidia bacterium]|nr:MFS transporter [Dehalococcoidia bacterium]